MTDIRLVSDRGGIHFSIGCGSPCSSGPHAAPAIKPATIGTIAFCNICTLSITVRSFARNCRLRAATPATRHADCGAVNAPKRRIPYALPLPSDDDHPPDLHQAHARNRFSLFSARFSNVTLAAFMCSEAALFVLCGHGILNFPADMEQTLTLRPPDGYLHLTKSSHYWSRRQTGPLGVSRRQNHVPLC